MRIDSYRFGEMLVNGQSFTSDLIIYDDHVDDQWWRENGHTVLKQDLDDILSARPEVLVVGRGKLGAMKIPQSTLDAVEEAGIQVVHARTAEAIEVFNQMSSTGKSVVGAFHLTC
ncbi:MAG TPA: Mth938-like domain-containing protein [Phycisphaerae bacterium]|nr:hypothetical protein [Phycisphaerae bacterium]HOI55030.1 Mth938-like domain-containing protein [Phycisphaerae bacterium]